MIRPLVLLTALAPILAGQEPVKQTSAGRVWLKVAADQPPLADVRVSQGNASPAGWENDPAVRARHTDILFPVRWWDWNEMTIRFTPAADGEVELGLSGPWEESKPGTIFRKEVLWDDLRATGTHLANPGFETRTDGQPDGWAAAYGNPLAADQWPLADSQPKEGKFLAASWQSRPLVQKLAVKNGQEVTLTLHARAATPPGLVAPKRLGKDTPAHRAIAKIKRGVNLGNGWEAPPKSWGMKFTPEDIDHIADEGFDHIRVPVAWNHSLKEGSAEIDPALFTDLEPVLQRAIDRKMHVMLNWHHFDALTSDPVGQRGRFIAVWENIARHFKDWPPALFPELLNEPRDALTTAVANPLYAETIAAIRKIDPQRIVVVSPGNWGNVSELEALRLPDDDDRIIVTFHCYEPFFFTHQGASWVDLTALRGIRYPGPPETPVKLPAVLSGNSGVRQFLEAYNTQQGEQNPSSKRSIREALDLAHGWSAYFGRPVHLGEFGSHQVADAASRERYSRDVRMLAEEREIPWTLWEWKAGFGYWDSGAGKPLLRDALQPTK